MTKYARLDDAILRAIGDTPLKFADIFDAQIWGECKRIADEDGKVQAFRVLDRRLQALRKLGVIKHVTGKGWIQS